LTLVNPLNTSINWHLVGAAQLVVSVFSGSTAHPELSVSLRSYTAVSPVNAEATESGKAIVTPLFTAHFAQYNSTRFVAAFRFVVEKSPEKEESVNDIEPP
jgi:hypothetical protein